MSDGRVVSGFFFMYFRTICHPSHDPVLPGESVVKLEVNGAGPINRTMFILSVLNNNLCSTR